MKISREWLLEFVDFSDVSEGDFAELISTRVAEVEESYTLGAPLQHVLVGRVVSVAPVPDKSSLSYVTVFIGTDTVAVICGAPNVKEGALVCYVPPGGHIRQGEKPAEEELLIQVEVKSFGAYESKGVLLSESELGIGTNHEGILILDEVFPELSFKEGEKLGEYLSWQDCIIDIDNKSLTHRPDLWSHFGFAREISALLGRPVKNILDMHADNREERSSRFGEYLASGETNAQQKVFIDPATKARRFSSKLISGLNNGESPLWLRRRLFSVGAGVRNVLVDVSNYVLHEVGQPNHAYDPSLLEGLELRVRFAHKDEKFTGLDDIERVLEQSDVVIADKNRSLALAGVIGGRDFSVRPETTEVLLESANFDPVFIRQVCKRHQVRTDSSNRFEKNLSPFQVPLGIIRYIDTLIRAGQKPEISTAWVDSFIETPPPVRVPFRPAYIRQRLGGVPETDTEIESIVSSLGFSIEKDQVLVPYYRATRDISIEEDLVEEVGRTIGYDRVPETPPLIQSTGSERGMTGKAEVALRDLFSSMGFTEIYNDTFSSPEGCAELGYATNDGIEVLNPVDQNAKGIRVSLVPSLLEAAKKNQKNFSRMAGFEIGRSYHLLPGKVSSADPSEQVLERRLVSFFMSVPKKETVSGIPETAGGEGFYSLKGVTERVLGALGSGTLELAPLKESLEANPSQDFQSQKFWMHPYRAASLSANGMYFGVLAEVRPSFFTSKNERLVCAEIDIEALMATRVHEVTFKEIPRYPDSFFEISLVLPKRELFSTVKDAFYANLGALPLKSIEPVSVYEGSPLDDSEKSLSLRFVFGKENGTIGAEELEQLREKVLSVLERSKFRLRA